MTDNRVRLNASKRSALKKEHWKVVLQTPCEQKDNLINAQTRFYSAQEDIHKICEQVVEARFPKADLDVMRKYNSDMTYGTTFTTMDNCFVLKNVQTDEQDIRVNFSLDDDVCYALNHDKLSASGRNPFAYCQLMYQGGQSNPQINTDRSSNERWLRDNFSQYNTGYGRDKDNPFSLEVVNTGGCHSRAYQVQDWQWQFVLAFEQAKTDVIQCHKTYYEYCKTNQDTMTTVIDQAKYLDEIQEYWTDINESILVNGDDISTNLAVVSEDRLAELKAMANKRQVLTPIIKAQQQNQA